MPEVMPAACGSVQPQAACGKGSLRAVAAAVWRGGSARGCAPAARPAVTAREDMRRQEGAPIRSARLRACFPYEGGAASR
eukprot:204504-Chlamydomonas_euryale.AAC.4